MFSQNRSICSSIMRSIRGSSSELPSRVPRLSGRRLEARRVLRKRATARNNVDRGIPSCARAASATSAVTFQPDCRNKSLSTAARRSTSGNGGSFGSTKPDDIASCYGRSTGRSIPFQVYKKGPPVPIWMPRKGRVSGKALKCLTRSVSAMSVNRGLEQWPNRRAYQSIEDPHARDVRSRRRRTPTRPNVASPFADSARKVRQTRI